jgi:hypothetical protein
MSDDLALLPILRLFAQRDQLDLKEFLQRLTQIDPRGEMREACLARGWLRGGFHGPMSITWDGRRALERLEQATANEDPPPPPPSPASSPALLTVDLDRMTITLLDQSYEVKSEAALRWVKVLADHAGDWISSPKLKDYDPELDGCRPDQLKDYLPDAVLDLIESRTGAGSRLLLRTA